MHTLRSNRRYGEEGKLAAVTNLTWSFATLTRFLKPAVQDVTHHLLLQSVQMLQEYDIKRAVKIKETPTAHERNAAVVLRTVGSGVKSSSIFLFKIISVHSNGRLFYRSLLD
jgi:hypothetical protein